MAVCRLGLQSGADRLSCGAVLCLVPLSAQQKLTAPEAVDAASPEQALHPYQGSARVQPSTVAAAQHCIPGVASPLLGHLAQRAFSLPVGCWISRMMPEA